MAPASQPLSPAAGEVRLQRCDVVVVRGVVGGAGASHLELLSGVGELEGGVWVGCVWEEGALPFQDICHAF